MEIFAKGQLSYMILNCLLERDFYGLDFISEINKKSNGRIMLKKPSVYSNLTRMEKQKYVSSYTQSSELGPNRRYYSITEKGKAYYQELKAHFEANNIDVFRDFQADGYSVETPSFNFDEQNFVSAQQSSSNEEAKNNAYIENEESENEDESDFFDFSSLDSPQSQVQEVSDQKEQSSATVSENYNESYNETYQNKITNETIYQTNESFVEKQVEKQEEKSIASEEISSEPTEMSKPEPQTVETIETEEPDKVKDDGAFLSREQVNSYNQHLYDISKDIRKYKKQRSFAEDQIAMTVATPLQESEERTRSNLEAFKNSLMENRNKFAENSEFERFNERQNRMYGSSDVATKPEVDNAQTQQNNLSSVQNSYVAKGSTFFQDKPVEKVVTDDGRFITSRITEEVRPKKIQPPRLKVVQQEREESLPPPKRDVKIDPSHKEIISQLYSKTKTGQDEELRSDMLYDYQDLSDFYKEQNIEFNEYKKNSLDVKHNTNKLAFYQSLIVFFLLAIASAATFLILHFTSSLNPTLNFLYILLPALQLIMVAVRFYNYKYHTSWIPKQMVSFWAILGYTLLIIGAVIGLNFIFGLNTTNFALYSTTLILPIVLIIIALPISYLIQKSLIVRHWK